jgi:hypothetical protein
MTLTQSLVDRITVRTPCTESWDAMRGDDRKRFCGKCRLHVYDISAMSRGEAETLLAARIAPGRGATNGATNGGSDRLCVRFARRPDGTVVTDDCGPVRRAIRRRAMVVRAAAAGIFAMFFPLAACSKPAPAVDVQGTPISPPDRLAGEAELGDVCPPEMGKMRIAPPDQPPVTPPPESPLPPK